MLEIAKDMAIAGRCVTLVGVLLTVCGSFFTGFYGKLFSGTVQVNVVFGVITLGGSAFCFLASLL